MCIGLGEDHLDQLLFRKLLFPHLGVSSLRRRGFDREIETRFPFEDFEELLINWAITYTLNQNRHTTPVMECIAAGGPVKQLSGYDVIKHNLSYLLFSRIKILRRSYPLLIKRFWTFRRLIWQYRCSE